MCDGEALRYQSRRVMARTKRARERQAGWHRRMFILLSQQRCGDRIFYLRDGVYGYYDLRTKENEQHIFEEEQAVVDRYAYWELLPSLSKMAKDAADAKPIRENEQLNLPLFMEFVLQGGA